MSEPKPTRVYEFLADAFVDEGVDTLFTVLGEGNMHWVTAMTQRGVRALHTRHEHCACLMAVGHFSATGKVSVASTTYGPGVTQISTALVSAASARIPLVVFAGETPLRSLWHSQTLNQRPVVTATGAHYISAHNIPAMPHCVREAFYIARHERTPVVLGVPYDLQLEVVDTLPCYERSSDLVPPWRPTIPHEDEVRALAERLVTSNRPIIIAGRGVLKANAEKWVARLAEASGALLATTLPARGMFDDSPFSIGVAGGYASPVARQFFSEADMVVAIGASLTSHTVDGGSLFPQAFVAQVDEKPIGLKHGRPAANLYLRADANLAAEALVTQLEASPRETPGFRTKVIAEQIQDLFLDKREFPISPGTHDPRIVVETLDRLIHKDWDIVSGSGHSSYFYAQMRHRRPERFHVIREFGAIGNGLGIAMGVASMRNNGRVVLLEGDGSLIMHIQEFETIARYDLPLLICVLNDGAYGSEIHKLRADGVDDSNAVFGRPDFAAIGRGFGLRGYNVTDLVSVGALLEDHTSQKSAEIWNFPVSDLVTSPRMDRRMENGAEAG